jgi:hypothetical protein
MSLRKMRLIIDYETDGLEELTDHNKISNELRRFFPFLARPYVKLESHSVRLLEHKTRRTKP